MPLADDKKAQEREYQRRWAKNNPARVAAKKKKYNDSHLDENHAFNKEYRNRPEVRARIKKYKRNLNLVKNYGITQGQYEEMLDAQGHKCACCGATEWGRGNHNPCVDHDHKTGKVRGILCYPCNTAAGLLRDNPNRLMQLAEYLWRTGGEDEKQI